MPTAQRLLAPSSAKQRPCGVWWQIRPTNLRRRGRCVLLKAAPASARAVSASAAAEMHGVPQHPYLATSRAAFRFLGTQLRVIRRNASAKRATSCGWRPAMMARRGLRRPMRIASSAATARRRYRSPMLVVNMQWHRGQPAQQDTKSEAAQAVFGVDNKPMVVFVPLTPEQALVGKTTAVLLCPIFLPNARHTRRPMRAQVR